MFIKNTLLICIILSYSIPLYNICQKNFNKISVSNIICDENCKKNIFMFMIIMGFFTILYENVLKG